MPMVLDRNEHNKKIEDIIQKRNYQILYKDLTTTLERNILKKHQGQFDKRTRKTLTPHYSKPPHPYGLPKIQIITNSHHSLTYQLAKFLVKLIGPLEGQTDTYIKNLARFMEIIKRIKLEPSGPFINYTLEANVPLQEKIEFISNTLQEDDTPHEKTSVNAVVDLLSSYFQVQKNSITRYYQHT